MTPLQQQLKNRSMKLSQLNANRKLLLAVIAQHDPEKLPLGIRKLKRVVDGWDSVLGPYPR